MSDNNPYEKLGLDENATFDEVQEARNRLLQEQSGDRRQTESIETAYESILMERLRLRQEGKIKVPDRIRFPERLAEPPPEFAPVPKGKTPEWLSRLVDQPSRADILLPAALFAGNGLLGIAAPALALALGVGCSLYFLNRKEHKFGRSLLLTLIGLVVGVVVGLQIGQLLTSQLAQISLSLESFAAFVTFFVLWLVSSFLR